MTRLLTLVVLALALVSTQVEARSKRIHVTAKIVESKFTGDMEHPKIGDQLISSAELFDKQDEKEQVGTGTGVCTVVSVPAPPNLNDTFLQCLLTATFDKKGQIIFGGAAPFPQSGIVATFGILGGTDRFHKARGEATLTVISLDTQDAVFEIE
jgi:Dirigent-like protein